ncbi:hypothetical protein SO694_00167024 [Aureococcus anophagefferens]|uniref:TsaA-like domain-containing protein n=1 Tax=Aureococcus anophagefferens TaxID=44056 RepID=A0ABR1G680_AURAN
MLASVAARSRLGAAAALACGAASCALILELLRLRRLLDRERRLRGEERIGRTRAEVSLRNVRKAAAARDALARARRRAAARRRRRASARAASSCPSAASCVSGVALDGLEAYSHAWLLFEFHGNTDHGFRGAKVAPPRGYGAKVGWLATRSPHRAPPLGLSLVKIEAVDVRRAEVRLSALDLCDGTPVWDLKPSCPGTPAPPPGAARFPAWVSQADELRAVDWTPRAAAGLEAQAAALARRGYDADVDGAALRRPAGAITQVLRQDPRNKRQRNGRAAGRGGAPGTFKVHFASLEVEFTVDDLAATVLDVFPAPDDGDRLRTETA